MDQHNLWLTDAHVGQLFYLPIENLHDGVSFLSSTSATRSYILVDLTPEDLVSKVINLVTNSRFHGRYNIRKSCVKR